MTEQPATDSTTQLVDAAVASGGAYEVLRRRLTEQGQRLQTIAESLNAQRLQEFGDSRMELLGRLRVRSEQNAVGRDIVQVGDLLLFGYNVFLGLKSSTTVADVFSLYRLVEDGGAYDVTPVDIAGSFLGDAAFQRDFNELYAYYKDARLLQLIVADGKLLASFQIGLDNNDVRVFRWTLSPDGRVDYIDARGERDIVVPPPFDFEWTRATKAMEVSGRFPHLNILDTLFVETLGGDLTIKVENNTETGSGVYSEPVEDSTQSLDDAQIAFAQVGALILLKILPYRETQWRGLVYNTLTGKVVRLDAIVQACIQLPDDHGIIFPGGYYLQSGEHKAFDAAVQNMQFKRALRSPNGEDVLYVFYQRDSGQAALLVYNMVQRQLRPPILAHGYARMADGRMVLFQAENDTPTRVHQMQVWQTPFTSDEFAATRPPGTSFMARLGNAELVRAVSSLLDLARDIDRDEVSAQRYESLAHATRRLFDVHHWIDDTHTDGLASLLHEIARTGESVLDEYEKVEDIRRQSAQAMAEAQASHRALLGRLQPEAWTQTQDFVDALKAIAALRGRLLTLREARYVDTAAVDAMGQTLEAAQAQVGAATGRFLGTAQALAPFEEALKKHDAAAQAASTAKQLADVVTAMEAMSADLDMLSGLLAALPVEDATERTRVVDAISSLYARLNQSRARAGQRRKTLGSAEAVAQFGAQFALFSQSVTAALGLATTPEAADEQLARLMVQLEELEGQFGEHEQFLTDILGKRDELLETFETHRQALQDDRQRKAQALLDAANRILEGLARRTERLDTLDALNAFFAGDALVMKLRDLATRLRTLKDAVKADDIEARIKAARDQAVRSLRDRADLFEDGGAVIKLGPRHRFSVNTQPLDLTLLPRENGLAVHLTGTEYLQPLDDPQLDAMRNYWQVGLESESPQLTRAEYLAGEVLQAAMDERDGLTLATLQRQQADPAQLADTVRRFAAERYRDGYEKGIHDHDATLLLRALLPIQQSAGALVHAPAARALAVAWWQAQTDDMRAALHDRMRNAHAVQTLLQADSAMDALTCELGEAIDAYRGAHALPVEAAGRDAAAFLLALATDAEMRIPFTRYAQTLVDGLHAQLQSSGTASTVDAALARLHGKPGAQWALLCQWLDALAATPAFQSVAGYVPEAIALRLFGASVPHRVEDVRLLIELEGLLGEHARVQEGRMHVAVDDLLQRLQRHRTQFVPGFRDYQALRQSIVQREREAMRLTEFQARPLTSFVRNRLINDVYLPLVGDNLAKQMGTVGEHKRSDLMGLLMLISPPGYGKTTLMEYVANRLGLVFMKINGPALGHGVRSLDPAQAPDATARQELEKLNLALEMGSNVMLYVDDIQHTHPEFLQKFITLCDATRRIEGVWRGRTRTYDLRGRKFAVVMAGNPYTESGEVFKVPDMLANRADIYNLGDVLGGREDAFLLSYIENALTSNPVLAPLATRDLADLYVLVDKAMGRDVSTNALTHAYSGSEINEIVAVLQRLLQVREVVYRVNGQYIASAAQADRYRVEPPYKLQGSYRNMNKLAEKISPVMNADEIERLLDDHYLGEAQLLTSGAEENLLKLAELRGRLTPEQAQRWQQVKADFLRNKAMGGADADVGGRVVAQLADISSHLAGGLQSAQSSIPWGELVSALQALKPSPPTLQTEAPTTPDPALQRTLEVMQAMLQREDRLDAVLRHLTDTLAQTAAATAATATSPPIIDAALAAQPSATPAPAGRKNVTRPKGTTATRFSSDPAIAADVHRAAIDTLGAIPLDGLLAALKDLQQALLSTDPRRGRQQVDVLGRLLGEDIEWQANARLLRTRLPVVARTAHEELAKLQAHRSLLTQRLKDLRAVVDATPLQLTTAMQTETLIASIDALEQRLVPLLDSVPTLLAQSDGLEMADAHARTLAAVTSTLSMLPAARASTHTPTHPSQRPEDSR